MFFTKILFNFLNKTNNNTKVTMQQIYLLYVILYKYNKEITFTQLYMYIHIFKKNFNRNQYILYIFLGYVFFLKTQKVKSLCTITGTSIINNINNITTIRKYNYTDFSNFWRVFKKLKRPSTEFSYCDFYINNYKEKITKYSNAGFLVLLNSFYVLNKRSKPFNQNIIKINKPLLISPKYSSSSLNKYIPIDSIQNLEFQFLRKNKVYNKGRYSRCRQNYRTGVYMCMYLSVVSIFGLYYWFYKFSFNFTYLWWFFISFVASFFLPKIIKYRLYEPNTLVSKFFISFKWLTLLIKSLLK